ASGRTNPETVFRRVDPTAAICVAGPSLKIPTGEATGAAYIVARGTPRRWVAFAAAGSTTPIVVATDASTFAAGEGSGCADSREAIDAIDASTSVFIARSVGLATSAGAIASVQGACGTRSRATARIVDAVASTLVTWYVGLAASSGASAAHIFSICADRIPRER
ncbi:hypothetical protein GP486_008496, partial [Trichoglossum hirsutum]